MPVTEWIAAEGASIADRKLALMYSLTLILLLFNVLEKTIERRRKLSLEMVQSIYLRGSAVVVNASHFSPSFPELGTKPRSVRSGTSYKKHQLILVEWVKAEESRED